MSEVGKTSHILTQAEFEKSPYKALMSYQEYFDYALKLGSTFTIARAMTMQDAKKTSEDIDNSVQGFYLEKEQKKDDAEEEYYAALAQYEAMKTAQDKALSRLNYATNTYGQDSIQYTDALNKYNISSKTLFGADVNLGIARDKFNFANTSAFRAYLSTQLT